MCVSVELSNHNQRQEQQRQSPDTLQIVAGGDHHKRIISINEELKQARQDNKAHAWDEVSIYRIPHHLKDGQEKAYEPQILSLGPYHHGKEHLREMERHKWRCLDRMLDRTKHEIRLYLDSIKMLEEKARACYEGTISLTSNEFVKMMVLDGCFVIELLRLCEDEFQSHGYPENDPIFSFRLYLIPRDMIMLENQIPLFILDRLLGLQLGNPDLKGRVAKLVPRFFSSLWPTVEPFPNSGDPLSDLDGLHCLDVFSKSLLLSSPEAAYTNRFDNERKPKLTRCVTELRDAGVRFRKKDTAGFWDISFKNGTLLIPGLLIQDGTRSLFLNLIAFEQFRLGCSNITSYVVFMGNLIDSPRDVMELHRRGIIERGLESDAEVVDLFNLLSKGVVFDRGCSYLAELSEGVDSYCNRKWNTWIALLKHKYFSNPWSIISLVAAFVLLLLTFTQTVYSVYSYYGTRS